MKEIWKIVKIVLTIVVTLALLYFTWFYVQTQFIRVGFSAGQSNTIQTILGQINNTNSFVINIDGKEIVYRIEQPAK